MKLRKGNVFTPVYDSVHRRVRRTPHPADIPLGIVSKKLNRMQYLHVDPMIVSIVRSSIASKVEQNECPFTVSIDFNY